MIESSLLSSSSSRVPSLSVVSMGGSSMTEPSAPPLDAVPTIVPSLPAEQEDGIVDAGIPTDAPTRDGSETIISFGDNDSSGAVTDMYSISALMIGLVSAFFALG